MSLSGLFVVGTDTGVGKTFVAAAIARAMVGAGRKVGALKPVATGATREGGAWRCGDAEALIEAIGGGVGLDRVAPMVYEEPLAPPVAARRMGKPLERAELMRAVGAALAWWEGEGRAEVMVVEGVGGLLCPLAEGMTVADLAVTLDYPLVVVARRGLGTINHTLLTLEAARMRGLRVAGVVLNGAIPTSDPIAEATNPGELARRLAGDAILAEVTHGENPPTAIDVLDWFGWARGSRLAGGLMADH